jgi:hypothetical protein
MQAFIIRGRAGPLTTRVVDKKRAVVSTLGAWPNAPTATSTMYCPAGSLRSGVEEEQQRDMIVHFLMYSGLLAFAGLVSPQQCRQPAST